MPPYRPAPEFTVGRDGRIAASYTSPSGQVYERNFGGAAFSVPIVENAVNSAVENVGESVSEWFSNNGVNVFAILLGVLIFIAFIILVAK